MTSLLPRSERRKAVWGSRRPRGSFGRLCALTLLMLGVAAQASAQTKQYAGCHFANLMAALFDVRAALKDATSRLHALDLPALNQRASIVAKQLDVLAGSVVVANDDQK